MLISRGAVQLSAYIDQFIASFLPVGAVAGITAAQLIYTLPVSLFGISVSAAELPALSGAAARAETDALRARMNAALERLTFFVVPSAIAFVALGDVVAGALLQRGRFRPEDSVIVWGILAGSAIGLVASTQARLYAVAHYALGDTKTPLRFAIVRIAAVTLLGWICALVLPPRLGIAPIWGAAGLTASAGVSGWIEFVLLRRSFNARIGDTGVSASRMARLWGAAMIAAAIAFAVKLLPQLSPAELARIVPRGWTPLLRGAIVLPVFAVAYIGGTGLLGIPMTTMLKGRKGVIS